MLDFLKSAVDCHYTDGGSIFCPVRNSDVDLDTCLACARLVDARQDRRIVEIRCTGSAPLAPEAHALAR